MNEKDISTIEHELTIQAPSAYRSLITGSLEWNGWGYVYNDAATLIGINKELRNGEFSKQWNSQSLVIGNDASGNMFFLDLAIENSPVFVWDHETHDTPQVAPSLSAFRDKLANNIDVY